MANDDYWFRARKYGYGSGLPIRWQGWAVLIAYVLVTIGSCLLAPRTIIGFLLVVAVATALLFKVCASRTRGGWRWRWGDES
ncbi:MAG TPA: hypothetical protein VF652_10590 [Allosphingosinicella sp.]